MGAVTEGLAMSHANARFDRSASDLYFPVRNPPASEEYVITPICSFTQSGSNSDSIARVRISYKAAAGFHSEAENVPCLLEGLLRADSRNSLRLQSHVPCLG